MVTLRAAWKAIESLSQSEAKLQYVALLDTLQPEWKSGKTTGKKPSWTVFSTAMGGQGDSGYGFSNVIFNPYSALPRMIKQFVTGLAMETKTKSVKCCHNSQT